MSLCYLRDKDEREVDFVVLKNGQPLFAVESKTGERDVSRHISYFASRSRISCLFSRCTGAPGIMK